AHFDKGFQYYVDTFFLGDGTPKYYHDEVYPIDIHSPAQLLMTLYKCERFDNNEELARQVSSWTIENMQDESGYFYYQIKKLFKNKIPYMRWSQAWIFCALSYHLREVYGNN